MYDGTFLQSVEGLGESPFVASGGEFWELLQGEKEQIFRDIQADGSLVREHDENDPEAATQEIEWRHRGVLEDRLRAINDAQDRLSDGHFGQCSECRGQIGALRLAADPAISRCLYCQKLNEGEVSFHSM